MPSTSVMLRVIYQGPFYPWKMITLQMIKLTNMPKLQWEGFVLSVQRGRNLPDAVRLNVRYKD